MQKIPLGSGAGEDRGTPGVGVKICGFNPQHYNPLILGGPPVAKAPIQNASDGEGRKLGERTGLDTPVVPAVNYVDFGVALE